MKTFDRSKRCRLLVASVVLGLLGVACGEDEPTGTTDTDSSQPITVDEIVVWPKAANPGDTLRLSAIVSSSDPNTGDIPSFQWSATGGAFLEDSESSVRWVAPATGVYAATVTAKNAANSATGSTGLFVADSTLVVDSEAGTPRLQPNQTDLYYLRTESTVSSSNVEVFSWVGGVAGDAVDNPSAANGAIGKELVYASDLSFEVHSADTTVENGSPSPTHVYIGDFATRTYRRITVDSATGDRHQAYLYPDVAPDSRLIAIEGYLPTPSSSGPDSFDIFVYDTAGPTRQKVTATHTNHKNAFPTWSTDQRWLTFVSDRTGSLRWELYGLPVSGTVVTTSQASLVRLSDTGGTLAVGNMKVNNFPKPPMAWSPGAPTLALLATDGVMYLVTTTSTASTQVVVGTFASGIPSEFAWSPDGSRLAVTTGPEMRNVASDGSSTSILTRGSDTFADLAWSNDSRWLVYRATRSSSCWFEVIDMNDPSAVPLPITAAEPSFSSTNSLSGYRGLMSMSPAWSTSNVLYYTSFATGASTVGIIAVDVSGLTP